MSLVINTNALLNFVFTIYSISFHTTYLCLSRFNKCRIFAFGSFFLRKFHIYFEDLWRVFVVSRKMGNTTTYDIFAFAIAFPFSVEIAIYWFEPFIIVTMLLSFYYFAPCRLKKLNLTRFDCKVVAKCKEPARILFV